MPASTRQQSEAEERAATSAALEAAEEQAAQAAAAEQRIERRRRTAVLSLSGFCLSFGSLEPLPEWLCGPSTPPPRGSSIGELQAGSKGFGGRAKGLGGRGD